MGFLRKDKNKSEETENVGGVELEKETETGQTGKKRKRRVRCVVIVFILIALCVAGVFLYFYFYRGMRPVLGNTVFNVTKDEAGTGRDSQDGFVQNNDAQNIQNGVDQSDMLESGGTRDSTEQNLVTQNDGLQKKDENLSIKIAERDGAERTTEQKAEKETSELPEKVMDEEVELEIKEPVLESETICGADGPILDYADENRIIFHDYYGLFVYDRESETITGAVDLQEIGCHYTQGDAYCDTAVDAGGETVYLHPLNADDVYIYEVEKQILTKKVYTETMVAFRYRMEQTRDYVEPDYTVWRSVGCAVLDENTVLYLESGTGLVEDLFYVVEEDGERMTSEHMMDSWLSGEDTAETAEDDRAGVSEVAEREENGLEIETISAETESMQEGEPQEIETAEEIDVSAYSEEEFRNLCGKVDYRKLLREQDVYLNGAVTVELTVLAQIDGGLFDDNIYYICTAEDKKGYLRYYVIRDDRAEDDMLILEGDVLRIYGQFFDTCVCPSEFLETETEIPALAMVYCDLLEE